MNIDSIKTRFIGSYGFLILLFVIQLPIIYLLIGGMSKKIIQVEEAASLRKRAVELSYLLNRNIMNGEAGVESAFQTGKQEYGQILEKLRKGAADVPAIKDRSALSKLDALEQKWTAMRTSLEQAKESGDALRVIMIEIENATTPLIEKYSEIVRGYVDLKDISYTKNINLAGLQRMRTADVAYLMERYARSNYDLDIVSNNLIKQLNDMDETFAGLKDGSAKLGLKATTNKDLLNKLKDLDGLMLKRKVLILEGMKRKDTFYSKIMELANTDTPQIMSAADELTSEIAVGARRAAMRDLIVMIAAIIISTSLAVFFMWATNNHLIVPIMKIKKTVEDIGSGELASRANIKINFFGKELKDEISSLGSSVDIMASQMSMVIGGIADSSNHLANASEELSSSSGQIASGADKQSSQTAQVATAMEEMNATVIEVAKNSQQVSESARNAQLIASKGGDVVRQAITAMKEVADSTSITGDTIKKLGKSSEEIGTIVSVINDIADQTNLLALNAAIEAARAGEQGRGFAVVADEVRKLAERTTKATKEISGMIITIQSETTKAVKEMADGTLKVENGVKLANEAGDALQKIVVGVQNVTDMINHIATSAEQQSATTDEISRNMDSIAEVSKTSVGTISEIAKAANEMAKLASELKELVARFRVAKAGEIRDITVISSKKRQSLDISNALDTGNGSKNYA